MGQGQVQCDWKTIITKKVYKGKTYVDKMATSVEIANKFKNNLVKFIDELIEMFPEETSFVTFRLMVKDQIPLGMIMDHFVNHILPLKDSIKKRDDRVFTENNLLSFDGSDDDKLLSRIWVSSKLDKDDKAMLWKWIDAFVSLADQYRTLTQ